ncbi:MAG: hypothetical protein K9L61_00255 [Candidatus Omnitrophica bacterium]|nr:hypothetical protein [Candidatus Omnitrophota bacterium]
MKKVILMFLLSLFFLPFLQAEDITLTTYYPSPSGVYQRLEVRTDTTVAGADDPYIDLTRDLATDFDTRLVVYDLATTTDSGIDYDFAIESSRDVINDSTGVVASDLQPTLAIRDSTGWGSIAVGTYIYCAD